MVSQHRRANPLRATYVSLVVACLCWSAMMTASAWGTVKWGGMDVHEAFPDARVATLVEAVLDHDWDEARQQLRAGADPNYVGTKEINPLIWVLLTEYRRESYPATEFMLKAGADPSSRDSAGDSAVNFAAGADTPEMLELLLKHGADPNTPNDISYTVIYTAVGAFRKENIELLLRYGADLNWNLAGRTVGAYAAAMGRFDWVAMFLERGLNHNLAGLARSVQGSHVPPDSPQQRWKETVISMLKDRGVEMPPPIKRDRPGLFDGKGLY